MTSSAWPVARSLELRTTTAMFMHGGRPERQGDFGGKDKQQTGAELRGASFKGVARYWFRSIAGRWAETDHSKKSESCRCLRCLESRVFGGAQAQTCKGVGFRVEEQDVSLGTAALLPHKQGGRRAMSPSIGAGTTFRLILRPSSPVAPIEELEGAFASLKIAVTLGGFGQRSRRGAGCVEVLPSKRAESVRDLAVRIEKQLASAVKTIDGLRRDNERAHSFSGDAPFPILSPDVAEVQVAPLEARGEADARAQLMFRLRDFKSQPEFGSSKPRRASPVWLHIEPLAGGFALVQTVLRSDGSEPGTTVRNWSKVDEYLRSFEGAIPVSLPIPPA